MRKSAGGQREVALPASAFAAIADSLRAEGGPLAAIHGLHAAGYSAGDSLYTALSEGSSRPLRELPEEEFWQTLSRALARRGWGTLQHRSAHPGVGLLISTDWAESEGARSSQPGCAFSVGLISHLLTRAAEGPVAVLEVTCRGTGSSACTFAFGSDRTIHELYGLLLDGHEMDQALASL